MLTAKDIDVVDVEAAHIDKDHLHRITETTVNTWQPDRQVDELRADTAIGKVAEAALTSYLQQNGIGHLPWDDVRSDNFQSHAPVDGFIMRSATLQTLTLHGFATEANAAIDSAHFTQHFRDLWEHNGVFGYEVKSTRIADRHRAPDGSVDADMVLGDDFLLYPSVRHGSLTDRLRGQLLQQAERDAIATQTPRILFRAYVEGKTAPYRVHLIGYIPRDQFFASPHFTVKEMPQRGKSERAIYYAVPLRCGFPMSGIVKKLRSEEPIRP